LQLLGHGLEDGAPHLAGRVENGVTCHKRHPTGVAAEVDGTQVRVPGHHADVLRLDAQLLGGDVGEQRVAALPDVGYPAVDRDAAAAVDLELRAGVRHVVPIDRQPGAADVTAQRQANALAELQLAELVVPAARLDHAVDA